MPAPIQNVSAFGEAELWYMYQQLTEINANTTGGSTLLTQNELYEVFNGTNPEGLAASLFNSSVGTPLVDHFVESLTGNDIVIANLLVETNTINKMTLANLCQYYLSNSLTELINIRTYTENTSINSNSIVNYLSTIRTPEIISTTSSGTIAVQVHNISIANVGSAVGTITVNGTTVNLPVGAVVNYDAGGNNNRFAINKFSYNGMGTTTLLIQYVQ